MQSELIPIQILGLYLGCEVKTPNGEGILAQVDYFDNRVGIKYDSHKLYNNAVRYYNRDEIKLVIKKQKAAHDVIKEIDTSNGITAVEFAKLSEGGYDLMRLADHEKYMNYILIINE